MPLAAVTRGHPCRYIIPPIRTETFVNSFLPSTTKLWNELPEPLVMIDNLTSFKDQLSQHVLL